MGWGKSASRSQRRGAALGGVLCLSLALPSTASAAVQPGEIFVADPEAGAGGKGAILCVDRASGAHTVVSSGGQFQNPVGVAVGAAGELFVADADALGGTGAVFRIDPGRRLAAGGLERRGVRGAHGYCS